MEDSLLTKSGLGRCVSSFHFQLFQVLEGFRRFFLLIQLNEGLPQHLLFPCAIGTPMIHAIVACSFQLPCEWFLRASKTFILVCVQALIGGSLGG